MSHAITINSCTSALEAALRVAGIGGEVVVPSLTSVATANAVVTSGARPIFCEVDQATRNLTAETVAAVLTPRSEAVMAVHYGGQPCAMDEELAALCGGAKGSCSSRIVRRPWAPPRAADRPAASESDVSPSYRPRTSPRAKAI